MRKTIKWISVTDKVPTNSDAVKAKGIKDDVFYHTHWKCWFMVHSHRVTKVDVKEWRKNT